MQLSPETTPNRRLRRNPPRPCPKPIEILHKCSSEPLLFPATADADDHCQGCQSLDSGDGDWFSRQKTCNNIYSYSPDICISPLRLRNHVAGYEKDTKVLITVTVEGSPGPIRTLVKFGTSVDETIKLVVEKYVQEGRTPRLDKKNASFAFDLHLSYFSFQSLDRSNSIGDIGSRSFYLRRSSKKVDPAAPEVVAVEQQSSTNQAKPVSMVVMPSFIARKFSQIVRRMRKLFKVFGCLQSR